MGEFSSTQLIDEHGESVISGLRIPWYSMDKHQLIIFIGTTD